MRRRQKNERNPLLDQPLVGALECARLWGYSYPASFKRILPELLKIGEIRTVDKLKGTFYLLEDILRVRYPEANEKEIQDMLTEHRERKIEGRASVIRRNEWIEPGEATMILGLLCEEALAVHIRKVPRIRRRNREGGTLYNLRDCFRRVFQEADDEELDRLIIDYKEKKLDERRRQHENPGQPQG